MDYDPRCASSSLRELCDADDGFVISLRVLYFASHVESFRIAFWFRHLSPWMVRRIVLSLYVLSLTSLRTVSRCTEFDRPTKENLSSSARSLSTNTRIATSTQYVVPPRVERELIHPLQLHKKNLLSLGEDRYLTTLILKHFPNYKTKFTPDAQAMTVAPDRWNILLSQRRRWINSTVHNLAELMFLPDMCGFCCFGMRFIVVIGEFFSIYLMLVAEVGHRSRWNAHFAGDFRLSRLFDRHRFDWYRRYSSHLTHHARCCQSILRVIRTMADSMRNRFTVSKLSSSFSSDSGSSSYVDHVIYHVEPDDIHRDGS